jgi:hypothetical protein
LQLVIEIDLRNIFILNGQAIGSLWGRNPSSIFSSCSMRMILDMRGPGDIRIHVI